MSKESTAQDKARGGNHRISKSAAYAKVAAHFDEVLATQLDLMRNAKQESVRASVANKLMDKVLPNLQAQDITTGGDKIQVNVVHLPEKKPLQKPKSDQ